MKLQPKPALKDWIELKTGGVYEIMMIGNAAATIQDISTNEVRFISIESLNAARIINRE
jgi:hypothetical protein